MDPPRTLAELLRMAQSTTDPFVASMAGAHAAATSPRNTRKQPTQAMQKAGNYKVGVAYWHGIRLHIENPAHTVREGVGEGGRPWRNVMQAHYGYVAGTRGADGDGLDVFLGPFPESRQVWVLNQTDAAGAFDEHKVLVGFVDERAAVDAYRLSYTPGWDRYRPPIRLSLAQLRWWLKYGDTTIELTPDHVPPETDMNEPTETNLTRVLWDSAAMPLSGLTLGDVLYRIRVDDARDGLLVDPMTMTDLVEGEVLEVMDALVTMAGKLKPTMAAMMRIMEAAGGEVKPLAMQISDPIRRYGGAHVAVLFELSDGQTITIWFHNPDATPAKLSPADDLVSWKWMLNKKDITIVVAPESGQDLNLREVARRVMRLAAKNSPAFARANVKRAETMAEIQGLKDTLTAKQGELAGLQRQIEVARVARTDREAAPAWKARDFDPIANYMRIRSNEAALAYWQDTLDATFTARIVEVRNALRALGWTGPEGAWPMTYNGAAVSVSLAYAGASNVVGVRWTVVGNLKSTALFGADGLIDDLEATPAELAGQLHADVALPDAGGNGEPDWSTYPEGTYAEWEDKLTTMVEFRLEADRSDAQGMVMAKDMMRGGILRNLFNAGTSAESAYQQLFGDESPVADDEETMPPPTGTGGTPAPDPTPEPTPPAPAPGPEPVAVALPENVFADIEPEAFALLAANPRAYDSAFEVEKGVQKRGGTVSWVIATREPAMPVLDSAAGGSRARVTLDSLFELDGSRFVRGDIAYSGKPVGAATINGKGETFFEAADGGAFNVYSEDGDEGLKSAIEEGSAGWIQGLQIPTVLDAMLSVEVTDAIDEEIRANANAAANGADDAESDGGAPPGTILDRDSAHWKRTLSDVASEGRGGKTALLGVLHRSGRRLTVNLVRKATNRADWYVVLAEPGKSKVKESIPFPAMRGNMKLLLAAGYLMGYLDADEPSGWRIAPPGVEVPAEDGGGWTLGLVTAEGLRGVAGSRGIAAEVFNERDYLGERAVIGATLEFGGVRATLEWKDGSESYNLRSIGDYDGQFDTNDTVLSKLLDQFMAFKPAKPEDPYTAWADKVQARLEATGLAAAAAQGMMDDHSSLVEELWKAGSGPTVTAERILAAAKPAPTESAEAKFLREVKAGAHDALALGDLLERIEAAVQALSDAGQLTGELDADAVAAINRWVELDQKANG